MAVLRCSKWGVDVGLFESSDIIDNDIAILHGQIIVISTWILDIIRDHIDTLNCIGPVSLIPTVHVLLWDSIEAMSLSIELAG